MSICLSYSKVLPALLLLSSLFRAFISFTGLRCCCVLYTNAGPASIVVVYHILVMCTVWRNVRETMDEMRGDGGGRPVESWSISNKKGEKNSGRMRTKEKKRRRQLSEIKKIKDRANLDATVSSTVAMQKSHSEKKKNGSIFFFRLYMHSQVSFYLLYLISI